LIKKMTGVLGQVELTAIDVAVGPLVHEVLVPEMVRRELQGKVGQTITLHTLEFLEGTPGRGNLVPRLVGFLSELEREFFDLICDGASGG
jgi:Holliday junction DNA helicase RuvA